MGRGIGSYIKKEYRDYITSHGMCFYCFTDVDEVCVDHIYPVLLGGKSEKNNLTGACRRCNSYKSHFTIPVFLERLLEKRDDNYDRYLSYSFRYRRFKKRNPNHSELSWLTEKMIVSRKNHKYYCQIIENIRRKGGTKYMAKDPAFLFYPNDWVGGTMGMTFEEKGAYMELLMMQFNRGHMTEHMIGQTIGQLFGRIKEKFVQDKEGLWYNERLEIEKEKRKNYINSRNKID